MRVTLLVLLWCWAIVMFLLVDLFLNVEEFDGIRPRASLYAAVRRVAHGMVGEPITDDGVSETGPFRVQLPRSSPAADVSDEPPPAVEWKSAWREMRRKKDPTVAQRFSPAELVGALRREVETKLEGTDAVRSHENAKALRSLLLAREDAGTAAEVAGWMKEATAVSSVDNARSILETICLRQTNVDARAELFRSIGAFLTAILQSESAPLDHLETALSNHRREAASRVLALISTPDSTRALLQEIEAGRADYQFVSWIRDDASVPVLADTLSRTEQHEFARVISMALSQGGPEGRRFLRQMLSGAEWRGRGPVLGAAVTALAVHFAEPADLECVEACLATAPDLHEGLRSTIAHAPHPEATPELVADHLSRRNEGPLDDALFFALSRFPVDQVERVVDRLNVARPGARSRLEQLRSLSALPVAPR